jgi:hypothetical protein
MWKKYEFLFSCPDETKVEKNNNLHSNVQNTRKFK